MSLLFFVLTILLVTDISAGCDNSSSWIQVIQNTNLSIYMNIPVSSSVNITISENVTALECSWDTWPCHIQCDSLSNSTSLSSLANKSICILNNTSTQLAFMLNTSQQIQPVTCNVTYCTKHLILQLMKAKYDSPAPKKLKKLLYVKDMCGTLFSMFKVTEIFISEERQLIHEIISIPFKGTSKDYDLGSITMTVVRMDNIFNYSGLVHVAAPQIIGLELSVDTWIPVDPFLNVSEVQSKVGIVSYLSDWQFMIDQNVTILSPVIRIEVVGRDIKDLTKLLSINFTLSDRVPVYGNFGLSCQHYDDKEYMWKEQKPRFKYNQSSYLKCSYNHMTPFAILLVDLEIDAQHWKILSYLTYVGCSLSALFSAASIAIYVFKKTLSTDLSNSIHVSLSAALFLLNVSFLFNELAVTWPIGACVFVAATIHYSLLCCFSWMVIEALHLYLLLVRVFNTYIRHYMIKLSLFSWGVPAVIVGLSLSVYNIKPFYGIKTKNMTDTNEVAGICWIIDDNFFYGVNLTYFTFTFLVNIAILSTVTCQICKLRHLGPKTSILPSCKDIGTVLGLSCLLGITWGLAFLTSGFTNYIILYLFCICNTLQGLFMFLWVYGTVRKNRRLATQNFTPSDHSSHSGTAAKTRETTLSDISNPS